ncbi:hypothetical protein S7711_00155 [Stachybotrys chartarum IBT 7711]|uniref:Uncharacterized protein n=1 Tax=Stachybotrys chartarum (strain CBS 109288 / IBT 7711) TaxID=1280523 RepID=A0A084B3L5_STACB|nr:hypothetical protein S7711_00155 [Stachybotrys chartarum IBT 7711]KFA52127.1 hypothetical protein S40293_00552 [Stachybotrys chartarum IBT 40293]KFA77217.1 hypothetical protein S40288_01293 [Stachybotrys chartarum IBT 40288]
MTTSTNFMSSSGLALPSGNLASRRGGQAIKPLTIDSAKQASPQDNGVPTPRTSRSHLLAGLRTAPKSATATSFGPMSPTTAGPTQFNRSNYGYGQAAAQDAYAAPKTAYPRYGGQQNTFQSVQQPQYTVDQVLAPPELGFDDQAQEQMDPNLYAQLVATNMYLAQQQQRLQQQLRSVQAAAQQFQQLNLNNPQLTQQQLAIYEQQQQIRNMQQQLTLQATMTQATMTQGQQYYYNPMNGQYYVDNSAAQMASSYTEQPMTPVFAPQQYQQQGTPRVQVSPPPETQSNNMFRSTSPPKRRESPVDVAPLPPPSANAFRPSHKKAPSLAPVNSALAAAAGSSDAPRSAGPRSALFPQGGYGPGQARAGEHPIRQPRGPPSLDELQKAPTAKIEGSKNFASRTRRSAVHNLVRAGLVRRKGTGSSAGSMSPVSETAEDAASTPITDNDSDSGRSGSGSLAGEMESSSSRTSVRGSWGAIGSDRPSSRQKGRKSIDSVGSMSSACESDSNSFADVFKNGAQRAAKAQESTDGQRKSRLVLTSIEKRKAAPLV